MSTLSDLQLKRSSLLNVYLNCKFEISLLTSHLFFSLFNSVSTGEQYSFDTNEKDHPARVEDLSVCPEVLSERRPFSECSQGGTGRGIGKLKENSTFFHN